MLDECFTTVKTYICVLLFFLSPLSYAELPYAELPYAELPYAELPEINNEYEPPFAELPEIDNEYELARKLHEIYFIERSADKDAHPTLRQVVNQYHKLLDARVVTVVRQIPHFPVRPGQTVLKYWLNPIFHSAYLELQISSSEEMDSLLAAFTSPLYEENRSLQQLIRVYRSVTYGASVQATMQNNMNSHYVKNWTLWFLANYPFYPIFKPHLKQFLSSTYVNGATPALYNVASDVTSAAYSTGNEDYLKDLGKEIGFSLLWALSCNNNGEELRNEISFMESCKLDKHSGYPNLKGLKYNESYPLESTASPGSSTIRLTPVPDYFRDFSSKESKPEDYSKKSLRHVMSKVLEDKTEGAMFFVLYRGADKYQFFTVGVYRGFLALSYIVDDHAPTPFVSFLTPIEGITLDVLVDGMHEQLHQSKSNHDMVPDLQGVWMMSSQ